MDALLKDYNPPTGPVVEESNLTDENMLSPVENKIEQNPTLGVYEVSINLRNGREQQKLLIREYADEDRIKFDFQFDSTHTKQEFNAILERIGVLAMSTITFRITANKKIIRNVVFKYVEGKLVFKSADEVGTLNVSLKYRPGHNVFLHDGKRGDDHGEQ